MKKYLQNIGADIPASIVVLLVALPLCLGIALASGAPLFAGIIAGIVGGIVVGLFSGSQLSVSGPAAGLTAIVAVAIGKMHVYDAFLCSVVIAGIIQLILGTINAGIIGDYIPNSVIKGMLAAIGLILILKQMPHLVGYDADFAGDENFKQSDKANTFSELSNAMGAFSGAAIFIGIISIGILTLWEFPFMKKQLIFKYLPGPLVVVIFGAIVNEYLISTGSLLALKGKELVSLPVAKDVNQFVSFFTFPAFKNITNIEVWITALTLAIVASLETLLGIEAVDKLDPLKRVTPTNRELKAQGIGNIVSGLIGGLPLTSVIVRGSANVASGAKSKVSAILHGVFLLIFVILIPTYINKIPLSALAAILVFTGYKLAKIPLFQEFYRKGLDQFIPFVVTIIAILMTDLLIGILVGIVVGLFFLIRSNFKSAILVVHDKNNYLIRLRKDVSFLNKPIIKKKLESVPANSSVLIDATRADFIDKDIIEEVNNFMLHAHLKKIRVEVKKSSYKTLHTLFNTPKNDF